MVDNTVDELPIVDRWEDGFGWMAHPDEFHQRTSHAINGPKGVWLIDPLDAPGLDDTLASWKPIAGILLTHNRHKRDADILASRYGVDIFLPTMLHSISPSFTSSVRLIEDRLGESGYRLFPLVDRPGWHEVVLYHPEQETLRVPETLGTAPLFLGNDERVGVHPVLRLIPPRSRLQQWPTDRLFVGHGAGIIGQADPLITEALRKSRRQAPSVLIRAIGHSIRHVLS